MKRYDSYKDSEIQWSPRIPSHWKVERIKNVFTEKRSTPNSTLNSGSISFGEVIYKDDESITVSTKESYQELLEGEFLINPLNLNYDLKSLRIGLSRINVVVSQGYIILLNTSENNSEFLRFLLREFDVRHIKSLGNGVRQTISFKHLSNELIPVPPYSEQQQIVSFLDSKTSQIDELIQKKERKIELLKEYRTSLINQVVTKGLNPNVEMKDSGVEWIGEIPSGWEKVSLGKLGVLYGGLTGKSGDDFRSEDHPSNKPFISFTNIFNNTYISKDHFQNVVVGNDENQNRVEKYDLFFLMSSEDYDDLGKSSILIDDVGEVYLNSFCKGLRVTRGDVYPLFLNYQLLGHTHKKLISIEGNGFTRINLRQDRLKETPMFIPLFSEQLQIVSYLDDQTQKIDSSIKSEERKIELLKEYRQSLISSVVTGKIDVRTN